jgi:2-succinyl-5-enolpyruvyl-6-hydroxy-3-cyclohexene-1-carboxylate synthase
MGGNPYENSSNSGTTLFMTLPTDVEKPRHIDSYAKLAKQVLEEVICQGVNEFCLCPGARNAPFVYPLVHCPQIRLYYWSEERSAAFFALGRIKATGNPVAVVTTSGTAAAELLPAAMEAHYTGLPLVLITADRPRRFRGTGAPQSAEQVGILSCYAHEVQDLEDGEECSLDNWTRQGPIHLNVCFEESKDSDCQNIRLEHCLVQQRRFTKIENFLPDNRYLLFLQQTDYPLVVVGALSMSVREEAIRFLLHLNAPVYAEGISGIREEPRLAHLRITCIENVWKWAELHGYPIDAILRIGGVPTARLWRDLEYQAGQIVVCSISENPFSGLSCCGMTFIHTSLAPFFNWAQTLKASRCYDYGKWQKADHRAYQQLLSLFSEEPFAEASLIHKLSNRLPYCSKVYLGNSLPIREWDQAATYAPRNFQMGCNRGVNGIDGQLSTFLGFSSAEQENWAIFGDLTLLYDLVAPWIMNQLSNIHANVVVINNGGAAIFARMFAHPAFQNLHQLTFEPFAQFWKWRYEKWESIPDYLTSSVGGRLIEIVPNQESTERFLEAVKATFIISSGREPAAKRHLLKIAPQQ